MGSQKMVISYQLTDSINKLTEEMPFASCEIIT
jgi:hypothetical protein